jgi:large subunit ribosomal protein L9
MKVILLEELPGRGGEGDVIEVARGFANNYLLRKGIAVKATDGNLKQLDQRRNNNAKREEVRIANAQELKAKLEAAPVTIKARVGEEGNLFGSVTAQMIADAVKEQLELDLDRRRVDARKAIKVVGEHTVEASLYRDIKAAIVLNVVDENGEVVAPVADEAAEAEVVEEAVEAAEEAAEEASEESANEE